jgi:hypothetical protein
MCRFLAFAAPFRFVAQNSLRRPGERVFPLFPGDFEAGMGSEGPDLRMQADSHM